MKFLNLDTKNNKKMRTLIAMKTLRKEANRKPLNNQQEDLKKIWDKAKLNKQLD